MSSFVPSKWRRRTRQDKTRRIAYKEVSVASTTLQQPIGTPDVTVTIGRVDAKDESHLEFTALSGNRTRTTRLVVVDR